MAKKEEEATKKRLERLSQSIGSLEVEEEKSYKKTVRNNKKHKDNNSFSTSEVVVLLLITVVVSLLIGGTITYKLIIKGTDIDIPLQSFIKNYEYIVNNYNGKIDEDELLNSALDAVLERLDKNSVYLKEEDSANFNAILEGEYEGIGIQIVENKNNEIVIYRVFENTPAEKAGLKEKDVIIKIDNKKVDKMSTRDVVKYIKGKKEIEVTYRRGDKEEKAKILLQSIDLKSVTSKIYKRDTKKIGYINVSIFASNTNLQFTTKLEELEKENIDSLIIDLRSNSGGYLVTAEDMISQFLDSSHVIYQIEKNEKKTKYYSKGTKTKEYKIVVMVDSNSASASEIMTSALKEQYGATIVGEKTYGKGTVQEIQTLQDGDKYKLTTKNWLTSKGNWVEDKGINPDVKISLDDKYFDNPNEENDNQLQKALSISAE